MSLDRRAGANGWLIGLCLLGLIGCEPAGEPPPTTFPVVGTVEDAQGQRLTNGAIVFRPLQGPPQQALADVSPEGRFALITMHEGRRLTGALPGEHEVTFFPASDDQSAPPVVLPHVRVEERDNEISLVLPAPQRKRK